MSQLIGIIHGREETFPPALVAEVNASRSGVRAESIEISGVEALARTPYRGLVDRISARVPYYRSFIEQQVLLQVPIWPHPSLPGWDRIALAQVALNAGVQAVPTLLLPHQLHPPGVEAEDLGNLAYPMPWEQYLQRTGLPGCLRPARTGSTPLLGFDSLSELWHAFGRTGHELHVVQPLQSGAQHLLVLMLGSTAEVLAYEPLTGRYRPDPASEEWRLQALEACSKLQQQADFFLTGLEFRIYQNRLWLSDLQILPDLEWWTLGEELFSRVVQQCAQELIRRSQGKASPPTLPKSSARGKRKPRA